MVRVISLLMVCLSGFAQGFGNFTDQPFFSKPSTGSSQVQTQEFINSFGLVITARWMSASLTLSNKVSTWLDETNHIPMFQATTNNQPTNSLLGVWLDANQWLNCTNGFDLAGSVSSFVIFRWDRPGSVTSAILAQEQSGGFYAPILSGINNTDYRMDWNSISSNTKVNIGNGVHSSFYTFNQAANNYTVTLDDDFRMNFSSGNNAPFWTTNERIGHRFDNNLPLNGYLLEWIMFAATNLNTTVLSNFYWYATNHYGP